MTMRVEMRAAVVTLLETYRTAATIKLQVYRARPRSINPPCAFIDDTRESRVPYGDSSGGAAQRTVQMDVVFVHGPRLPQGGSIDSGDAVDQADVAVDGFTELVDATPHAIGGNTTIGAVSVEDDANFVPDWVPPEEQRSYYATRIVLEGYAGNLTI